MEHRCQWCGVVTDRLFCEDCTDELERTGGNPEL